jgi:hypothetical protein
MTRKPIYHLRKEAYLFPDQVQRSDERKQLEEPVRQWCAHELIRAYGIMVSDLELERPVRMGSRNGSKSHRIDILVLRDGSPYTG